MAVRKTKQIRIAEKIERLKSQIEQILLSFKFPNNKGNWITLPNDFFKQNRQKEETLNKSVMRLENYTLWLWKNRDHFLEHDKERITSVYHLLESLRTTYIELAFSAIKLLDSGIRKGFFAEEYRGDGFLGLVKAARRFDLKKGKSFGRYAVYWVHATIDRAQNADCLIQVPNHFHEVLSVMQENAIDFRKANLSYEISDLTCDLDITPELLYKYMEILQWRFYSFDHKEFEQTFWLSFLQKSIKSMRDLVYIDLQKVLLTPKDTVEKYFIENKRTHAVMFAFRNELTERQQFVLERRYGLEGNYGLGDDQERTLSQVGQEMGLSRERVRQIEIEAFERLRKATAYLCL